MPRLTVSKLHSVTRYEVTPTERQTEDVWVEPVDCGDVNLSQSLAQCFIFVSLSVVDVLSNEVFEANSLRQFANQTLGLHFPLLLDCHHQTTLS